MLDKSSKIKILLKDILDIYTDLRNKKFPEKCIVINNNYCMIISFMINILKVFITKITERLLIAKDGIDNGIIISGIPDYGHILLFISIS